VITLMPALICYMVYMAVDQPVSNIKLGVVNDEVALFKECFDPDLRVAFIDGKSCRLHKTSCRFIADFNQSSIQLVGFLFINLIAIFE
jgi:hypothetical protein